VSARVKLETEPTRMWLAMFIIGQIGIVGLCVMCALAR
jgi:hypothetical protein